ncbi:Hermansky-Pudlak syndrome 5 protein homolog [Schistocerca americana]|uniref:Hermansky-Pudlak syndrome 5 protein homolog n=1 Tax=Schistocerca americana TaxID=7009 RepID=UPI001F4FF6DB|nr:Hermansky-Pudlak syndrome 5 protein homolog [Schistocerca americana]XP_047004976.1 Hermansky-Pudlak syndrome 5 protein homolog [Schistocerca americana]XP_047004977.1 Hermansky-Pudlak syndrome 5 protein homolog [Schistocerca americana]
MGSVPYVLSSLEDVSSLYAPLRSTQRIKYTCFTVSKSFLIFGATSGGLYVFRRESCVFLQLIPNKEGPIQHVTVSPDEQLFAFATVKGAVCMLERNHVAGSRHLHKSSEHVGTEVTALCWGAQNELYIGDALGRVSVLSAPVLGKNVFSTPSFQLMQLDSRVVQMDGQDGLLLVSTLTRSFICDTIREQYRQIGQKLREGEFGGCFAKHVEDRQPHMFCARPGSRIWEAASDGTVLSTHQFKLALAVPPEPVISYSSQNLPVSLEGSSVCWNQQSFNFAKLLTLSDSFLFTFKSDGLYIFDPYTARVILWNNSFTDIVDAGTVDNSIYVWTATGKMHVLTLHPLEKFLLLLYFRKQYTLCGLMCKLHEKWLLEAINTSPKLCVLADLTEKLELDQDLVLSLSPLLKELSKHAEQKQIAQRLDSGIFIVGNDYFLCNENNTVSEIPNVRRTEHLKDKSRSLSLSPERNSAHKLETVNELENSKRCVSHSSLPDVTNSLIDQQRPFVDNNMNKWITEESCGNYVDPDSKCSDDFQTSAVPSQEAVQALREIGQSVTWTITNSTKSLKQKWQFLEDKVKNFAQENSSQPSEALSDCQLTEDNSLVNSERAYEKQSVLEHPNLNVSDLINICDEYRRMDIADTESLRMNFCSSVIAISCKYNHYINRRNTKLDCSKGDSSHFKDESEHLDESVDSLVVGTAFPFHHYFSPERLETMKLLVHDVLKHKSLVKHLKDFLYDIELPESSLKDYFTVISQDSLKLDVAIGRFLSLCSEIIEPETVLDDLRKLEVPCYFTSLSVLLNIVQTGASNFLGPRSIEKSDSSNGWSELLLLNALFITMQMGQTEMYNSVRKEMYVKDICYLAIKLEQYMVKHGESEQSAKRHCHFLFLSCVVKLPNFRNTVLDSVHDSFLANFITTALESVNQDCGKTCKCGYPLETPSSEKVKFIEIGTIVLDYFQRTDHERALLLCKQIPHLWFNMLHKKCDRSDTDLKLIVQLGSIQDLEEYLSEADVSFWNHVLSLVFTFRSGICLGCSYPFTVEKDFHGSLSLSLLGALIVKSLGPHGATSLFKKHSPQIQPGELDAKFFQSCIFAAMVNVKKDGLQSTVVDRVQGLSGHSSKVATFSSKAADRINKALHEDGFVLKQTGYNNITERANNHHWGARLDLSHDTCALCCLPLGSQVLLREGQGLTAYPCGHVYHTVCLRKKYATCPLCC